MVVIKGVKRWSINDYPASDSSRQLLNKVYIKTTPEAWCNMAKRYVTQLKNHLPTLESYFNNVVHANPDSVLVGMCLETFAEYCNGIIEWETAVNKIENKNNNQVVDDVKMNENGVKDNDDVIANICVNNDENNGDIDNIDIVKDNVDNRVSRKRKRSEKQVVGKGLRPSTKKQRLNK